MIEKFINSKIASPKIYSKGDFPEHLYKLNALYDDLFLNGKYFRSRFVAAISKTLSLNKKDIQLLSQTIEFIHNASLLHDDLIDRANLRRGKTAAWKKYGPESAVLAGDYLLARVMVNLSKSTSLSLVNYTAQTVSDLLEGEWLQDVMEEKQRGLGPAELFNRSVVLKERDRVAKLKTGVLFSWCLVAPFLIQNSGLDKSTIFSLKEIGNNLGVFFQRGDDLLDFGIRNKENKSLLTDLKSGVLNSFAVFLIAENQEWKKDLLNCSSLDEVKTLISAENFNQALKDFDKLNAEEIDRYYKQVDFLLESLSADIKVDISKLKNILNSLPDIFYWRKN